MKIEAVWLCNNRKEASKLEYHIKKLKKQEKEIIIYRDLNKSNYLKEKVDLNIYKKIDKSFYINYN